MRSPGIRPEGLTCALGVLRALSRMVKDAARVETPSLRVFDACYDYLIEYNLPAPKACTVLASSPRLPTQMGPKIQGPTLKRSRLPAREQKAEQPQWQKSGQIVRIGSPPLPQPFPRKGVGPC